MPNKSNSKTLPKKKTPLSPSKSSGLHSSSNTPANGSLKSAGAHPHHEKKDLESIKKIEQESLDGRQIGDGPESDENEELGHSSGGSSNAAALAAMGSANTEVSASFKNFRHHPDMENFYRFIYENDLRHEALAIIDQIMSETLNRKTVKVLRTQPH